MSGALLAMSVESLRVGLSVAVVQEIVDRPPSRPLPRAPAHLVGLAALGGEARLAGTAPVEGLLDVRAGQFQPRRAPVDDAAEGRTVALAEGRDAKQMTERVVGHESDRRMCGALI